MKTSKAIPYLMVAGLMAIGTACSSTNTDSNASTTAGTGVSTGSGSGSTSATSDAAASGTDAGSSTNMGTSTAGGTSTTGGSSTSGTGLGNANASGAMTGADAAADMTAFMGTFATMKDPVFLMSAASSNMLEIQAGQLAAQKSANPEVKKFAQMMVSHHTKATQDLKTVATPLGVTMPQAMMPVHQAMADRLMNKTGKDFDEAYMDMMETAHKMDIAMFEVKSKGAESATVQSFATKTLPMLRSHHKMADAIEKKAD